MSKFWKTAVITLSLVLAISLLTIGTAIADSKLPSSCTTKLDVTWKIGTRGYGGFTDIELQGEYEVVPCPPVQVAVLKDLNEKFKVCFKPLRERLVKARGAFGKEQAVFGDSGNTTFPGGIKTEHLGLEAGQTPIDVSGWIFGPSSDGAFNIILSGPGINMLNGAAEEASGCWGDWPKLKISSSMLRDLHTLRIKRSEPVSIEGTDCHGEMTVEISGLRIVRKNTLPDPENPIVTNLDCIEHRGVVSYDGIWCMGGDFGCYRIKEPAGERKPKSKTKGK